MADTGTTTLTVLSLLNDPLDHTLREKIRELEGVSYRQVDFEYQPKDADSLVDSSFWKRIPLENADIILVEMPSRRLKELARKEKNGKNSGQIWAGWWSFLPGAMIAVLPDDSLEDAIIAAQLDFDGIIACPFAIQQVGSILENARQRHARRNSLFRRYQRMRQLCRQVNRQRRRLRDKVDLLCHDLVQSNASLANILLDLRRAYNFQADLIGEFDIQYLMHKGLRQIKEQITDSSGAIYICRSSRFEAHISGAWYDKACDIPEIEQYLEATIVKKVLETGHSVFIPQADSWNEISTKQRKKLAGLSLMALPVIEQEEFVGVVVIYRNAEPPLTQDDLASVKPLVTPFGRIIFALQQLEPYLNTTAR